VELVGDVNKDGGAARRDAAAGDEEQEPGEELFYFEGSGPFGRRAEEFGGEILGVVVSVFAGEIGSGAQGEVTETETELRVRAGKAAALAVGEAVVAAGRLGIGAGERWQDNRSFG
jgi:hypothetical protein